MTLIIPSGNKPAVMKWMGRYHRSSVRAHISPVSCVINAVISQRGLLDCWSKFSPRELTSTIVIQYVNFIDRKCSLDSQLSEFEGIIVIGDIYWILEGSETDWRLIFRSLQCVSFHKLTRVTRTGCYCMILEMFLLGNNLKCTLYNINSNFTRPLCMRVSLQIRMQISIDCITFSCAKCWALKPSAANMA